MSVPMYYLCCEQAGEKLYIHFDDKKKAYIVGDSLKGACLFTEKGALNMVRELNSPEWKPYPASFPPRK